MSSTPRGRPASPRGSRSRTPHSPTCSRRCGDFFHRRTGHAPGGHDASFDIAALEMFLPLIVGGRVELVDRDVAVDGASLVDRLDDPGITFLQATPSTWRLLLEAGWRGKPTLTMLCGGEALPRALADRLNDKGAALWNLYGPTETTVWSSACRVEPGETPISIGGPIADTRLYVLDKRLRAVPVGVTGELYIGGAGLARGYRNRPGQTAERFLPDPFGESPGGRLYRTGDLARWRPDGTLECLGGSITRSRFAGFASSSARSRPHWQVHVGARGGRRGPTGCNRRDEPGRLYRTAPWPGPHHHCRSATMAHGPAFPSTWFPRPSWSWSLFHSRPMGRSTARLFPTPLGRGSRRVPDFVPPRGPDRGGPGRDLDRAARRCPGRYSRQFLRARRPLADGRSTSGSAPPDVWSRHIPERFHRRCNHRAIGGHRRKGIGGWRRFPRLRRLRESSAEPRFLRPSHSSGFGFSIDSNRAAPPITSRRLSRSSAASTLRLLVRRSQRGRAPT